MSEGECSNLSFEEIYEAYFAKMKRFSKEYVLSDEDAENIVHDVFWIYGRSGIPFLQRIICSHTFLYQ